MTRYSRQERFIPIGEQGQAKLATKHVLIVGAGALGAPTADLLARAGIGKISIIDRDFVDLSNLQRQTLYTERDVVKRLPKASAAKQRLLAVNADVQVAAYDQEATVHFLEQLLTTETIDLIFDGTDNFDTRFIINDIAHKHQVPWIYGACVGASSLSLFIEPNQTPCLHCIMGGLPTSGPTCDTVGILASASQITAAMQVAEALKYLTDNKEAMRGTVFSLDVWQNTFSSMDVASLKKDDCPTCGTSPSYPFLQQDATTRFASLCGRDTVQIRPTYTTRDLTTLANKLTGASITHHNEFLLTFEVTGYTLTAFRDGRVFVHGTADVTEAKKIYYQYFA